ncbi:hypothetical protein RUM43_004967 [Polyplax serrata]|uniref:Uncharacterized protein n=1 Tax=Polyplax serrata TaxID=468196 RepID=A0AAN8SDP1_POLSC
MSQGQVCMLREIDTTKAEVNTNIALYIGLAVALTVFSCLVFVIYKMLRPKGRNHSMYNRAASGE